MTTTIPPVAFSGLPEDDGWADQPIPDLGLVPAGPEHEDNGDPDDDPAGAGTVAAVDPEAPWGRFKNGKPKKKPRGSKAPARRVPAPPRRTAPAKARATTKDGPDYEAMSLAAVRELTGLGGIVANLLKNRALVVDVVTVSLFEENIAQVSADYAADEPRWGKLLERFTSVSKWSAPISLGLALVAQGAVNHGMLPPGLMGSREPSELLDLAEKRAKAAQEQADKQAIRNAA